MESELMTAEEEEVRNFLRDYKGAPVDESGHNDGVPLRHPKRLIYGTHHNLKPEDVHGEVYDWIFNHLEEKHCPYLLAVAVAGGVARRLKDEMAEITGVNGNSNSDFPNLTNISSEDLYTRSLKYMDESISGFQESPNVAVMSILNQTDERSLPITSVCAVKNGRSKMEDRHVVIHDLNQLLDLQTPQHYGYYAIFDGHAGIDAASYAASHLHQNLAKSVAFQYGDPAGGLREAFSKTDLYYLERSAREKMKSGCTAVVCLIEERKRLFVSWLGDSQAFLVRNGKSVKVMEPHKPEREDEKARIEEMGGIVSCIDIWRVNGTLAVSRAIGDPEHKPFVSSDADVEKIELDGSEDFIIMACDGLWDQVTPDEAVEIVYRQLVKHGDPKKAGGALKDRAIREGSMDNITIIILYLKDIKSLIENPPPFTELAEEEEEGINGGSESVPFDVEFVDGSVNELGEPFSYTCEAVKSESPLIDQSLDDEMVVVEGVGENPNPFENVSTGNPFEMRTKLMGSNESESQLVEEKLEVQTEKLVGSPTSPFYEIEVKTDLNGGGEEKEDLLENPSDETIYFSFHNNENVQAENVINKEIEDNEPFDTSDTRRNFFEESRELEDTTLVNENWFIKQDEMEDEAVNEEQQMSQSHIDVVVEDGNVLNYDDCGSLTNNVIQVSEEVIGSVEEIPKESEFIVQSDVIPRFMVEEVLLNQEEEEEEKVEEPTESPKEIIKEPEMEFPNSEKEIGINTESNIIFKEKPEDVTHLSNKLENIEINDVVDKEDILGDGGDVVIENPEVVIKDEINTDFTEGQYNLENNLKSNLESNEEKNAFIANLESPVKESYNAGDVTDRLPNDAMKTQLELPLEEDLATNETLGLISEQVKVKADLIDEGELEAVTKTTDSSNNLNYNHEISIHGLKGGDKVEAFNLNADTLVTQELIFDSDKCRETGMEEARFISDEFPFIANVTDQNISMASDLIEPKQLFQHKTPEKILALLPPSSETMIKNDDLISPSNGVSEDVISTVEDKEWKFFKPEEERETNGVMNLDDEMISKLVEEVKVETKVSEVKKPSDSKALKSKDVSRKPAAPKSATLKLSVKPATSKTSAVGTSKITSKTSTISATQAKPKVSATTNLKVTSRLNTTTTTMAKSTSTTTTTTSRVSTLSTSRTATTRSAASIKTVPPKTTTTGPVKKTTLATTTRQPISIRPKVETGRVSTTSAGAAAKPKTNTTINKAKIDLSNVKSKVVTKSSTVPSRVASKPVGTGVGTKPASSNPSTCTTRTSTLGNRSSIGNASRTNTSVGSKKIGSSSLTARPGVSNTTGAKPGISKMSSTTTLKSKSGPSTTNTSSTTTSRAVPRKSLGGNMKLLGEEKKEDGGGIGGGGKIDPFIGGNKLESLSKKEKTSPNSPNSLKAELEAAELSESMIGSQYQEVNGVKKQENGDQIDTI